MSLTKLVIRNLLRHPIRSALTALGAMVAIFLLIFLRSIVTSLDDAVDDVASDRVITYSAVSLFQALPANYGNKLKTVDGIELLSRMQWFGGYYKDPANFFAQFAIDQDVFQEMYGECKMDEASWQRWADNRKGCMVGSGLSEKYGWKIGDQVQLVGTIFPRSENRSWDFDVCGIYTTDSSTFDPNSMYFHYDYLEETYKKDQGIDQFDTGLFVMKIRDPDEMSRICTEIDETYKGGPQRTLTQPESAFQAAFISMLGDIPTFLGWIGAAVVFALSLSLINTMLIASAERIGDIGVLKALGFSDATCGSLMIAESLILSLGGGALGCALAFATTESFRKAFSTNIPRYAVRDESIILAFGVALIIGLASGIVPALRARRLHAAHALRAGI